MAEIGVQIALIGVKLRYLASGPRRHFSQDGFV